MSLQPLQIGGVWRQSEFWSRGHFWLLSELALNTVYLCCVLRPFSVYSMCDRSRQRFFCFVWGKKKKINKNKIPGVRFVFFAGDILKILVVFGQKNYRFGDKNLLSSHHVGGKNKIKLKCQFFFLVRDNLISLEDSSPIFNTENGLMLRDHWVRV